MGAGARRRGRWGRRAAGAQAWALGRASVGARAGRAAGTRARAGRASVGAAGAQAGAGRRRGRAGRWE